MKVCAIIAAAGNGDRMCKDKVYLNLNKKPVIVRAIAPFQNCDLIYRIVVVAKKDRVSYCESLIKESGFEKVVKIIPGGEKRQDSVYEGLIALEGLIKNIGYVMIHDGVRPFVNERDIYNSFESANNHGASNLAIPVNGCVKYGDNGCLNQIVDQKELFEIQTPQTFKFDIIMGAHKKAIEQGYHDGRDDASLVERIGGKVSPIPGSIFNIKITRQEDMIEAEMLARLFDK